MSDYQALKGHRDLKVYQLAYQLAMEIFEASKSFPKEETYSLTDQMRRSSRSVCSNLAEAFRKRRYPKAFISKLSDSEGESAETQTWIDFAASCQYIKSDIQEELNNCYENIIGKLINTINLCCNKRYKYVF